MTTKDADQLDQKVSDAINSTLSGKYERKHAVGRGAYGQVWLVKRVSDGAACVAKVMAIDKMHRYEQEVQCLARCDHFNIVRLVDTFQSTIGPIIILDFADGGDLSHYVKGHVANHKNQLLAEELVGSIFVQLVLAIHHIHTKRMMHRDIKSANVLMLTNGLVKVSDFGFSRQFDNTVSQDVADTFLGTPYYLAPELWKRQKYSKKADIWSLGVVLYELLTLKRPFTSSSMRGLMNAIIAGEFEKPSSSQYSEGIREVLAHMLTVDSTKRPSTAEVLNKPIMRKFVDKLLKDIAANSKLSAKEKDECTKCITEQMENLQSAETIAAITSHDAEEPEDKSRMEGPVQIGSVKEWKPRYVVLNDEALIVTRVREDRRSQKLPLNTILSVAPAEQATGAEHVLIVSLDTGYTVWIKATNDDERDQWIKQIQAAKQGKAPIQNSNKKG
jgi:serine/threonine protein kinase